MKVCQAQALPCTHAHTLAPHARTKLACMYARSHARTHANARMAHVCACLPRASACVHGRIRCACTVILPNSSARSAGDRSSASWVGGDGGGGEGGDDSCGEAVAAGCSFWVLVSAPASGVRPAGRSLQAVLSACSCLILRLASSAFLMRWRNFLTCMHARWPPRITHGTRACMRIAVPVPRASPALRRSVTCKAESRVRAGSSCGSFPVPIPPPGKLAPPDSRRRAACAVCARPALWSLARGGGGKVRGR